MDECKENVSILAMEIAEAFGEGDVKSKRENPESVKIREGVKVGEIIELLAKFNLNK